MSTGRGEIQIGDFTVIVIVSGVLVLSSKQVPESHTGVEKEFGAVTGNQYSAGAHLNSRRGSVHYLGQRK